MKKRILIPSITALAITSLFSYQLHRTNIIKDGIKNQVIVEMNSIKNEKKSEVATFSNTQTINRTVNIDNSYSFKINNIYNDKLFKINVEGTSYLNYTFDADISFSKNQKNYNRTINSNVIVNKINDKLEIKSIDDLEEDLIKALIKIKKENLEDISEELTNISLIYQNEDLDIQIKYPDYYTYNSLKTEREDGTEYNVSFYLDNNKTSNYIQFTILSKNSNKKSSHLETLLEQGYELQDRKLLNPNGIEFSILTQSFTQNFKDITEIIYLSNDSYKDINSLIVTVKLDSSLLKTRSIEIEELIKSFK